jgi:hypothetical protein
MDRPYFTGDPDEHANSNTHKIPHYTLAYKPRRPDSGIRPTQSRHQQGIVRPEM